jgi:hypothetical protein
MGGKSYQKGWASKGKGKGSGKPQPWSAGDESWAEHSWAGVAPDAWAAKGPSGGKGWAKGTDAGWEEEAAQKNYARRRQSKDLLSKQILKVCPDENGNALVGGVEAIQVEVFRGAISPDNSELDARAAHGFSMMLSAFQALGKHLPGMTSDASRPVRDFIESDGGQRLLELATRMAYERIGGNAMKHVKDFREVLNILQNNKGLMEHMPQAVSEAAATYLGLVWAYDGLVHANGMRMWVSRTPSVDYLATAQEKWKSGKPTVASTATYLAESYVARRDYEKSWSAGKVGKGHATQWVNDDPEEDDAWQNLAGAQRKKDKTKKAETSGSDSESVSDKKEKKKGKSKKSKKDKKKKKDSSSSSSGEDTKKAKKRPKNKEDASEEAEKPTEKILKKGDDAELPPTEAAAKVLQEKEDSADEEAK